MLIAPEGELTCELMGESLEDKLSNIEDDDEDAEEQEETDQSLVSEKGKDRGNEMGEKIGDSMSVLVRLQGTLFTNKVLWNMLEDIGDTPPGEDTEGDKPVWLESLAQRLPEDLYAILGSEQVTRRKVIWAPPWIVEEAVKA